MSRVTEVKLLILSVLVYVFKVVTALIAMQKRVGLYILTLERQYAALS